jgi:Head domain of trimeric autotransporter adhesin
MNTGVLTGVRRTPVAFTDSVGTLAFGDNTTTGDDKAINEIVIGNWAAATATGSIAIGSGPTAKASPQATGRDSIAIGGSSFSSTRQAALASGAQAIAIGPADNGNSGAKALGNQSIAIGSGACAALTDTDIALGWGATASGGTSLAIGAVPTADAQFGIAIGNNAVVHGQWAIGIGQNVSIASACLFGVAIGSSASCTTGSDGVAIGVSAAATAISSTALGDSAWANANYSVAIGCATKTNATQSVAIGGGVSNTAGAQATAQGAIAIGASNASGVLGARATGISSVAIGGGDNSVAGASASHADAIVFGRGHASTNTKQMNLGDLRLFMGVSTSVPADADLIASQMSSWYDEANQCVMAKIKNSSSVVRQGVNVGISPQYLQVVDDFLSQNTANGDVGQLAWRTGGTGGSTTADPGISAHPGMARISSGGTTNFDRYINLGDNTNQSILPAQVDRLVAVLKPLSAVTSEIVRFGLFQDANVGLGTDGIYFNLDTGTSTNWNTVTRAASTNTSNASIAVTQNNWYQFELRRVAASGNWEFWINGTLRFTHSTNIPTVALTPGFYVQTLTTATREVNVDYFAMTTIDLSQRWT